MFTQKVTNFHWQILNRVIFVLCFKRSNEPNNKETFILFLTYKIKLYSIVITRFRKIRNWVIKYALIFILFYKQAFLILVFWHLFLKFFWGPLMKTNSWLPFPCKKPLWKVVFLKYFQDGKWFNGYSRSKCVLKYCQNSNPHITVLHITLKVTSQLFMLSVQTQSCENIPSTFWQFF